MGTTLPAKFHVRSDYELGTMRPIVGWLLHHSLIISHNPPMPLTQSISHKHSLYRYERTLINHKSRERDTLNHHICPVILLLAGSPCFLPLQTPPAHLPAPPDHAPLKQDHHCPCALPPSAQRVTIQTSPTSLNSTSRPADILPAPMRGQGTEACFGK
ncbi:hypothetical protein Q8A67_019304 [Cirrhinus molitorella]|uniref:Uncharacterized protein n=1 Tax=Cirrhinus molitorella TaxID=172907 RepID=A0AA88PAH1_9TELE|nr:hypothetical protein Q8A67_019304 [Cirrhinus molitorella]